MAYNMKTSDPGLHNQPFFTGNMAPLEAYVPDFFKDIDESWIHNIDPLLREAQIHSVPLSWQEQQPLQKWITEPERALFTAGPLLDRPRDFPRLMRLNEGVSSFPQVARMVSPSPSGSQDLSSQCSSVRSPRVEFEPYSDTHYAPQKDQFFSKPTSRCAQGLPNYSQEPSRNHILPPSPGYSCVSLNQVQGFEDFQEVNFEAEHAYAHLDLKHEYSIEVDHQLKSESHSHCHSPSDEGLGASIKDEGSPSNFSHVDEGTTDADAEAETEEEIIVDELASDTEYSPNSSRNRKRRISKAYVPPNPKRRMTKSLKSKSTYICKFCAHTPFKDATSLQRHINTTHTRAFVCVFAFAGCTSTFTSKNEWKRHVSSQHLNLNSWVCDLGNCGKGGKRNDAGASSIRGSEFNRKDLFTQHLRRMHAPFDVKRKNKKNPEWEDEVRALQASCMRVKRLPPRKLACPVQTCDGGMFEGHNCWDERMEHVGKHLEKAALASETAKFEVRQEDDELLVDWALTEHIVERTAGGGFRLGGQSSGRAEDEDADAYDD